MVGDLEIVDGSCWQKIPVYSEGIWNIENGDTIFQFSLIRLQIQLASMIILPAIIHFFLKRFNIGRIISEILGGILLGPGVLGTLVPQLHAVIFPKHSDIILSGIIKFGFFIFAFLISVKMDASIVKKSGLKPWIIGTSSCLIPLLTLTLLSKYKDIGYNETMVTLSETLVITRFPVVAVLLLDLKIINTELGRLTLATVVISEMWYLFGITLTSPVITSLSDLSIRVVIGSLFMSLVFLAVILGVLRPVMLWIIKQTPEGKTVKEIHVTTIMITMMGVAILTDASGLQFLFAPILVGLVVPTGPPLEKTFVDKYDTFVSGLLIPLLATHAGFKMRMVSLRKVVYAIPVTFGGWGIKIVATIVPALCYGMPFRKALALSVIMCISGVVELGTFHTFMDYENDKEQYAFVVYAVLITSLLVPVLVKKLHPLKRYSTGEERRIMSNPSNAELGILVCALRQDDAIAAVKLLEVSNPTIESSLSVCGLCLDELIDRSNPILINHQFNKKDSSESYRRKPIMDVFNYYKTHEKEFVSMQLFTAISPHSLMHEDVCWVAFEKSVSIIILPFHKIWTSRRQLILNSTPLRKLNINVLERAPCSVGILIDRRNVRGTSSLFETLPLYRIAVFYLGGGDDREALAYAKRMTGCPRVELTIVRFVTSEDTSDMGWDNILDNEYFRETKHWCSSNTKNVRFMDEVVKDGADTTTLINSMQEGYDLFMVGRQHDPVSPFTSGLSEWTELPELGSVGDLLASSDITNHVSVLVVQQYKDDKKK